MGLLLEDYNQKFSGQTCFIIAAGPSIHGMDLSFLKKYQSFAVNSGYIAYKDANFFVSDDWAVSSWSFFYDLIKDKNIVPLLYENKLKKYENLFENNPIFFRHRQGYYITDVYEHSNPLNHICQARTSVGSAIHIAHIMGFKEVILLGVDCFRIHSQRYFWEFNKNKPYRTDKVPQDSYVKTNYKGRETDQDLLDILKYWENHGKEFLKKIKVFNGSQKSLISVFPKIDLSKYV